MRPALFTATAVAAAAAALLGPAATPAAQAQVAAATPPARVVQLQGDVRIDGAAATPGMAVAAGTVATGADGRVQIRSADGSFIALPPNSTLRLNATATNTAGLAAAATAANTATLVAGGLRLNAAGNAWQLDLPNRSIRTNGYLKLQDCAAPCSLPPGLYGRIAQGEAVLEYQGGRVVLRNRSFRWISAGARPEVLATQPALLDDAGNQLEASRVFADAAATLKTAVEAFRDGDDAAATRALEAVRTAVPGETLVPYYLGLIALKRQDNDGALRLLQQYAREDPDGAAARDVPKTLTLLSSSQLQQEVATAVARERDVASSPPEPGSIAVQAFVNRGDEAYRAMAKGLAAMVISDLTKVPGLKVLEREKVQLLVNEARLGDSGFADTASAVRSGRLMRAEKVVVGNFEVQR